jgi:hypothetical protein
MFDKSTLYCLGFISPTKAANPQNCHHQQQSIKTTKLEQKKRGKIILIIQARQLTWPIRVELRLSSCPRAWSIGFSSSG